MSGSMRWEVVWVRGVLYVVGGDTGDPPRVGHSHWSKTASNSSGDSRTDHHCSHRRPDDLANAASAALQRGVLLPTYANRCSPARGRRVGIEFELSRCRLPSADAGAG